MPLINIKDMHKSYGTDVIFNRLNLTIYRKEKVGFIGSNGSGKTTLFKILNGMETYDTGEISKPNKLTIGYLPQEPILQTGKTVIQQVHTGLELILNLQNKINLVSHKLSQLKGKELEIAMKEYDRLCHEFEIAGGYEYETRVKTILTGVGLGEEFYGLKTDQLSGGQKSRLGLATVLLGNADLLLLDEPTNHLDLAGCQWLEKFIKNFDGAAIIISHDRYLLDNISDKIFELRNKDIKVYKGNYSKFLENKEKLELGQQREYEKRAKFVAETEDFIKRNINEKGMQGTARGRKKRLERLLKESPDYLSKPENDTYQVKFEFDDLKKQSHDVLKANKVSKSYGTLKLFENLSFEITAGQRLAITGPNGTGKTTLLRLATGQTNPDSGEIKLGRTIDFGYLDQQARELDPESTPLEHLEIICPDADKTKVRSRLGAFGFRGDDVFKKIENLSGGEQHRLLICSIISKNPELLLLDEPTNHLDIQTREALEEALAEYKGTIIAVSHDRFFLDKIAQRLLVIGADQLGNKKIGCFEFIDGGYSSYIEILNQRQANKNIQQKNSKVKNKTNSNPKRKAPSQIRKFNSWSIEEIESEIEKLEKDITVIQEKFGDEENYKLNGALEKLQSDFDNKQKELDLLYMAYEHKIS